MASHLKMAAFNMFKPHRMTRSAMSNNTFDRIGICFTVKGDLIGELAAHSMESIFAGICSKQWRYGKPRDVYSIWPA